MHPLTLQVALGCFVISTTAIAGRPREQNGYQNSPKNVARQDDMDLDSIPKCAQPYCNSTAAWSPSRLGCIGSTLTKDCFCKEAVTPLNCVPSGPSSEDNCWYDVEDWFAGQCSEEVALISTHSMPECLRDCALNWLHGEGCLTDTRNCFCKLDGRAVVTMADKCRSAGCAKHMLPKFDAAFWREQICSQGEIENYDDAAYRSRRKMVKNVQVVVPIFVGIIAVILAGIGFTLHRSAQDPVYRKRYRKQGSIFVLAAIALVLLIIPPIFVAI